MRRGRALLQPRNLSTMRVGLYQKIFLWLLLNLILLGGLAAAVIGVALLKGSGGFLPTYLFSGNIESAFRTISAHCQYKPASQWAAILQQYSRNDELFYTIYSLDAGFNPADAPEVPAELAEAAENIPRYPFTLCPDPSIVLPGYASSGGMGADQARSSGTSHGIETGIQPNPKALFMRAGNPARYWLAQALFIPDDKHDLHYVLLAASSNSLSGRGLFFDVRLILYILGGGLLISCLWWWPFVRHISKPLKKMTAVAEKLATDAADVLLRSPPGSNICGVNPAREDEIGWLGRSINVMAQHLYRTLFRQRRFISHIAHEISLPLADIRLGLAEMEADTGKEAGERIRWMSAEVEHLSILTGDIMSFLRAESAHQTPVFEKIELRPFITKIIGTEAADGNVRLFAAGNLSVYSSRRYLGRAIANVLRNSLKYAGTEQRVEILITDQDKQVRIEVLDRGPGVPEEDLALLAKPFFRSSSGSAKSGAGLGLSIVKYCAEICKGTVSFANRRPSGFAVTILIPKDAR